MSLLNIIQCVRDFKLQPFIAPVWNPHTLALTIQHNIPSWVQMTAPHPSWFGVVPNDKLPSAKFYHVREYLPAQPWQAIGFLSVLPRFYALSLFHTRENTWLCVPFNASDAAQRNWPDSQPREVYLVNENIRQLDCIIVREFAGILLYDSISQKVLQRDSPNLTLAQEIIDQRRRELERVRLEAQRFAREIELRESLGARIEDALDFMGADVVQWEERGEGIEVSWTYNGYTHTSTLRRDMTALSAGICLEGTDGEHTLTTLVATIEEARRLHRFDMPRESYL